MTINDDFINHFFRNQAYTSPTTIYLALFSTAPGINAIESGVEVGGGSYARQAITLTAPVNGLCSNANALDYTGMPAVNVVAGALYDAVSGGNFMRGARFSAVRVVSAGTTFNVPAGSLIIQAR